MILEGFARFRPLQALRVDGRAGEQRRLVAPIAGLLGCGPCQAHLAFIAEEAAAEEFGQR